MAVLGLGLGVIGCGGPSLERSLADARESFAEADYPAAAIFLRNALQADGTNVDARLLMGEVSLQLGDLAGARNHLEWVADQGVPAAVYGMPLSRVYVDVNDAALALPLLDDIDDQYGDDARYWLLRSDALRLLGDYVGAASALARAEEQAAPRVEVSLRRAWLAFIDGERATAQAELGRALEADPGNARVYELRGRFAAETGDLAAAATDFETAVGLYRSANQPLLAAPMLMALVELRLAAGDMEAAQAAVAQLGAVAPGAPMTSYAAALVAVRAGRYEDAQANLRSALSGVPGEPRFLTLLGATHLALGNLGQAEQQFLLVLDRDRSNTGVLRMLVETRLRQDRAQSAVSAFSTFPAANDDNDLALLSLRARALLRSGDPAAAVRVIDRALTLSPDNQTLIMQQVEAQLAAGDPDAAAASLGLATDLTGDADLEASVQILIGRIR
jgi:tetratricopeptide (TPR) repeat protein